MSHIVILGAGTGGTMLANRLVKSLPGADITVVDPDPVHVYQPGLLFVPFGLEEPDHIVRPRARQLHKGVTLIEAQVERVDLDASRVVLDSGIPLTYDVLVVATGTRVLPEETEGMMGPLWHEAVFDFYTLEGATKLRAALEAFHGGRLVVNVVDMPIKCPVAPLEFVFLADWYFQERGVRKNVEITYVTPLDGAFTKPVAAKKLGHLLEQKNIKVVTEFATGAVDNGSRRLVSFDEREVPFDLAVVVPVHGGADFVGKSPGLGDALGFVPTDLHTLQSLARPNVFALGDCTNLPTSKAGSVTHFEGLVVERNIQRFLDGEPLVGEYDGHANCFVETGFHKALLLEFNYEQDPLPGKFPLRALGPLSLLEETRLNHWSKLAFQWAYWNLLLPGRELPFVPAAKPPALIA
jgi:sulfide:quinone oxidoreductase